MESVIASHFEGIESFRNFFSIGKFSLESFFFISDSDEGDLIKFFGKIVYESSPEWNGILLNGLKEGFWVFPPVEGGDEAEALGYYKHEKMTGFWIDSFDLGSTCEKGFYIDGKREGYWIKQNSDLDLIEESYYVNSVKNGIEINYEDGVREAIGPVSKGNPNLLSGFWVFYDEEGRKSSETLYDDNGIEIFEIFYRDDGTISSEKFND